MTKNNVSPIITITGVGMGLPGPNKPIFAENNIDRLLRGDNFISKIDERKVSVQKRQNIIQKQKIDGKTSFKNLTKNHELIRLAGEAGKFDLIKEYGVGDGFIDAWEITTQLAIAVGLEALKDANIPLIYKNNRLSLPNEMIDNTGIIFASTFPTANTFLKEQANYYRHLLSDEKQIIAEKLKRKLGKEHHQVIDELLVDENSQYHFDRKYLLKAIPLQSGIFAQIINAKGPNTHINSACASTTQAIAIAEDWIKAGRCKRVIIIAADDPTNEITFQWLATGFLAAGAATTEDDVKNAARPFDKYRSGMILGMGAAGIVIEDKEIVSNRGVNPIARVLGSYFANSAFHGTRMDPHHIKSSFRKFMDQVEQNFNLTPSEISKSCLYMSHETFTPPKGNAAKTEIEALREVFDNHVSNIVVSNTKGLTAHPMGVSIEDVATIKSLELNKIPPVANLRETDFTDIQFSTGEKKQVDYAIRFAAGFGSQLAYILFRNYHRREKTTPKFKEWISNLPGGNNGLQYMGKTLILKSD